MQRLSETGQNNSVTATLHLLFLHLLVFVHHAFSLFFSLIFSLSYSRSLIESPLSLTNTLMIPLWGGNEGGRRQGQGRERRWEEGGRRKVVGWREEEEGEIRERGGKEKCDM